MHSTRVLISVCLLAMQALAAAIQPLPVPDLQSVLNVICPGSTTPIIKKSHSAGVGIVLSIGICSRDPSGVVVHSGPSARDVHRLPDLELATSPHQLTSECTKACNTTASTTFVKSDCLVLADYLRDFGAARIDLNISQFNVLTYGSCVTALHNPSASMDYYQWEWGNQVKTLLEDCHGAPCKCTFASSWTVQLLPNSQ